MNRQKITVKNKVYFCNDKEIDFSYGNTGACFMLICGKRTECDYGIKCELKRNQEKRRKSENPYLYGLL
jgi:hypothetical protein